MSTPFKRSGICRNPDSWILRKLNHLMALLVGGNNKMLRHPESQFSTSTLRAVRLLNIRHKSSERLRGSLDCFLVGKEGLHCVLLGWAIKNPRWKRGAPAGSPTAPARVVPQPHHACHACGCNLVCLMNLVPLHTGSEHVSAKMRTQLECLWISVSVGVCGCTCGYWGFPGRVRDLWKCVKNLRVGKTSLTFINDSERLIKQDKILNRAERSRYTLTPTHLHTVCS